MLDINLPEILRHEIFVLFKLVYDKPQGRELASAVADYFLVQSDWVQRLQPQRLKPGKRCADTQVQLRPCVASI